MSTQKINYIQEALVLLDTIQPITSGKPSVSLIESEDKLISEFKSTSVILKPQVLHLYMDELLDTLIKCKEIADKHKNLISSLPGYSGSDINAAIKLSNKALLKHRLFKPTKIDLDNKEIAKDKKIAYLANGKFGIVIQRPTHFSGSVMEPKINTTELNYNFTPSKLKSIPGTELSKYMTKLNKLKDNICIFDYENIKVVKEGPSPEDLKRVRFMHSDTEGRKINTNLIKSNLNILYYFHDVVRIHNEILIYRLGKEFYNLVRIAELYRSVI